MYRFTHAPSGGAQKAAEFPRQSRRNALIRPKKKSRCTDLQARTRFSFSSVSALWKKLPDPFRKTWIRQIIDRDVTIWCAYLAENATRIREGEPAILCPGSGLDLPHILRASSPAEGAISIWSTDSRPILMTVIAQKIENGMGSAEIFILHDLTCEQLAHIDGFSSGEYFVYCVCTDAPLLSMTRCSPSAAFKVAVR